MVKRFCSLWSVVFLFSSFNDGHVIDDESTHFTVANSNLFLPRNKKWLQFTYGHVMICARRTSYICDEWNHIDKSHRRPQWKMSSLLFISRTLFNQITIKIKISVHANKMQCVEIGRHKKKEFSNYFVFKVLAIHTRTSNFGAEKTAKISTKRTRVGRLWNCCNQNNSE